jgi:hypothetical protein
VTNELKGRDSEKYFSGARKAIVVGLSITGIILIFEIDCFTILAKDISK